jgi:LacI family transcriptional regulator
MMRKVTIRDVARAAGVSVGSVSRVLNNSAHVSPDLRFRVEQAVSELGFVPSFFAQGMRGTVTHMIGIIVRDIASPLLARFVRAAQEELEATGYVVLVACHDERKERELDLLRILTKRHVDGLIMTTSSEDDAELVRLRELLRVPVVLYDREIPRTCDSVRIAHKAVTRRALDYLLDLGHRRIALVTGAPLVFPSRARLEAYDEAFAARGLAVDPRFVRARSFSAFNSFAEICGLLDLADRPTALLLGGIDMLAEALRAVHDRGLAVPGDISLIGAGDSALARLATPPVTVVSWDFANLGQASAHLLKERLTGTADMAPRHITFPAELVIRGSCAPPRNA